MKARVKKQILELLNVIIEGLEYCINTDFESNINIIHDCKDGIECIVLIIKDLDCYNKYQAKIYDAIDNINQIIEFNKNDDIQILKNIQKNIKEIKFDFEKNECKVKILFLPYKLSMWDSMESIWKTAIKDDRCECAVVPICYYDRNNDGTLGEVHYEGNKFPLDINILSYEEYNIEKENPDIVYIHNPYDAMNRVTMVDPKYHSNKLTKYTDKLVYVAYFIYGYSKQHQQIRNFCLAPANNYANKIILQNENLRESYIRNGIDKDKLLVLGNPKFDAILDNRYINSDIPLKWKEKLLGKKIILLNTSITSYLNENNWLEENIKIVDEVLKCNEVGLIWRPHPLLRNTINAMTPNKLELFDQIIEKIDKSNNIVVDYSEEVHLAIELSNGLISDYSSILFQYVLTGKPVLSLVANKDCKNDIVYFDFFSSYFLNNGTTVKMFIDIIIKGEDFDKEIRLENARKSIVNGDGTSGIKIHEHIMSEVLVD